MNRDNLNALTPELVELVGRLKEVRQAGEGFQQAMFDAGLISEIKRPNRRQPRDRRLVPIQGKPLSETIIEERR